MPDGCGLNLSTNRVALTGSQILWLRPPQLGVASARPRDGDRPRPKATSPGMRTELNTGCVKRCILAYPNKTMSSTEPLADLRVSLTDIPQKTSDFVGIIPQSTAKGAVSHLPPSDSGISMRKGFRTYERQWHKIAVCHRTPARPDLGANPTKFDHSQILAANDRYRGKSCRGGDIVATFTTDRFGKFFLKFFFRMTFRSRIGNPGDLAVGLVCREVGSHQAVLGAPPGGWGRAR